MAPRVVRSQNGGGCPLICAEFSNGVVVPMQAPPESLELCPVVLVTGAEIGMVTAIKFPTAAEFGAAWLWGFTLVVGCYLAGWATGAVLRFLGR